MIPPRKAIANIKPYNPPLEKRQGKTRLDFNESMIGCSPKVLEAVRKLMNDKDFSKQKSKGFTLVFHKFEELRKDIEKIILPDGGRMMVRDDEAFLSVMQPFFEDFFPIMAKDIKRNKP